MELCQICREIEAALREELDRKDTAADEEIEAMIDAEILNRSRQAYIPLKEKLHIRDLVFHSIRGYDCLEELLKQEDITEVMINGYERIFIERNGRMEAWEQGFSSEEKYMDIIQKIVARCNRIVNESSPIVDARLEDGSRVNVVLPPIALNGAVMTIRRFPRETYGMEELVTRNMLSKEIADVLQLLIKSKYNIMISGGTGSGKTTFLNALANTISKEERIITIEDSAELQLREIPNLVRMEVRNANIEGENAIPMKALIRSALRMRPDRIVVGEVRGEEALDMLQAMNTGHNGSLSTGHANSAKDILYRLETMVLMGIDMPLRAIRQQIASAIDVIVHIGRQPDGSRRLLEVAEVTGIQEGEILLHSLYQYQEKEKSTKAAEQEQGMEKVEWKRLEGIIHEEKLKQAGCLEAYKALYKHGTINSCSNRNDFLHEHRVSLL
ncbi:MAG: CpaF family protein [Bacteroides sp.]|nr:CpaF family protein [Bacteroides sp.]MCM1549966.1 CpaF family protein [Clostridium sp.]